MSNRVIGMGWQCVDGDDAATSLRKGIAYFKAKHNREPQWCEVHPDNLAAFKAAAANGLRIHGSKYVQPNCLWIGPISGPET